MTHVLLTRPLEASQQLADQLDTHGMPSIVMPLYTFIARVPSLDWMSAWPAGAGRKLAVFTSTRAVQFGLSHIPLDVLDSLEFAVIGSATRKALESAGRAVHLQASAGYTSEDLLSAPELADDPGSAVIFCAPGGRVALAQGLSELGWTVSNALVYERLSLQPGPEQLGGLLNATGLISVWTSVSAIELAHGSLPQAAWNKIIHSPALVISVRIKQYLEQLGATGVVLADGPGNPELLQSILRLTDRVSDS